MSGNCVTGIDRLAAEGFARLQGRRIGLITNHTGLDRTGAATADLLHQASGVDLRCLFGPEHGIRGLVDEHVPDGRDERTGLPVYSLYGDRTRPQPGQLEGIDTLVYDIQDIGCRFYTYSSTLGLCMEAAAAAGLKFVVLDRPNPIGGDAIEGPIADSDRLDFVAYHTVPIRHGLTSGELARLFQVERTPGVDLDVVKVEGWRRSEFWDSTGLIWTNPSPNMRSLTQALLYPGMGLPEFTNVSVGRGTDTPFEVLGAPWIDPRRLAARLNDADVPGIRFVPVRFTPKERQHAGKECHGVNIVIVDRASVRPVLLGLTIAEALLRLFPESWEPDLFDRLLVSRSSLAALRAGASAREIEASWAPELADFERRRAPALLYS